MFFGVRAIILINLQSKHFDLDMFYDNSECVGVYYQVHFFIIWGILVLRLR